MGRYSLSSAAELDAVSVWKHIAADNPTAADRMIDRLTHTFERIAQHPRSGERVRHPAKALRKVVVAPYVVVYQVVGDEVLVVRILHGARRWEDLI